MHAVRLASFITVSAAILLMALFTGPHVIVPFAMTDTEREILFSIRLPRVSVALLMGVALGASGAVQTTPQPLPRNAAPCCTR